MIDHDRLFKELLQQFFLEFLALFTPDLAEAVEPESVEFLDKEVFADLLGGERREADVVARVRLRSAGEAFLIVQVEHQSKAQSDFARRMFFYFARFHEKYGLPVYPIALFSYDAPARPEPSEYRVAAAGKEVLSFQFETIQLNRLSWRDYLQNRNPVASALMARMKIAPEDRSKVKLECLRLLATLRVTPAKMHFLSGFIDTYLRLNAAELEKFERDLEVIAPSEREGVMEMVTSWMEEGIERGVERGIEQGLEKGIERGEEAIVLRQLRRRFGDIPEALELRIHSLGRPVRESFAEALLDFTSLADAETWLTENALT